MTYDYLIVGAGLFGAVFAHEAHKKGHKVLVIEKRSHIAGNAYTQNMEGIEVHQYGAHIFHTSNRKVWDYVQQFASFNRFTNSPLARYQDELYHLPFNMNTFHELWGIITPKEAMDIIQKQIAGAKITTPTNLEEQAISLVGTEIYEKLIKGYTEKQWGCEATKLPSFIIRRLPIRYTYNNNYFNDDFQGIPVNGYTKLVKNMLEGIEVRLETDFFANKEEYCNQANQIIYTGRIDQYYDHCFGPLAYRSLSFEHQLLAMDNYQGNAVINYTDASVPYTRIIEHKHFVSDSTHVVASGKTIITKEYPSPWQPGCEPYYPINDATNTALYEQYAALASKEPKVFFCGRLGTYRYLDMHVVIEQSLQLAAQLL
ncbi:MAG TPA: UDP-galactopyranose mutase [Lachnospiraceae bacterium]|nr:UDP-galactopyranose mutase [Lachnospiraceae bacterium]